jgi:hypothetical protein
MRLGRDWGTIKNILERKLYDAGTEPKLLERHGTDDTLTRELAYYDASRI